MRNNWQKYGIRAQIQLLLQKWKQSSTKEKKLITHDQECKLPQIVNEVEVVVVVRALLFAKDIGTSSIILKVIPKQSLML